MRASATGLTELARSRGPWADRHGGRRDFPWRGLLQAVIERKLTKTMIGQENMRPISGFRLRDARIRL